MPFLTGDTPGGSSNCYPLFIPDDLYFRLAVRGAIHELTLPENWEKFGDLTPDEAAQLALTMYNSFVDGECSSGGDMELIASVETGSDVAYIEFTSIPGTYETIILDMLLRTNVASTFDGIVLTFNGDTGNNYDYGGTRLQHSSSGMTASSARLTTGIIMARVAQGGNGLATNLSPSRLEIPAYARSDERRVCHVWGANVSDASAVGSLAQHMSMGLWRNNTVAITTLRLSPNGGTVIKGGSRVYLYGLKGS